MDLVASVRDILEEDIPTSFERFGRVLDAEWIDAALAETGTASIRRRKIPAQLVVWLVIGMALFPSNRWSSSTRDSSTTASSIN